jgi:hypothetical protein
MSSSRLVNTVVQLRSTELAGSFIWAGNVIRSRFYSQTGTVGTIVTVYSVSFAFV